MPRPRKFDDDELVTAVQACAPAGTSEVADEVDATRQAVHGRLNDLADDGRIKRKQIAKVQVWFTDCR
ncbi:hypothetical protein [Salarchaeum sp. JOR-1]|uniref:hypothetical protein n=1 Tax=Salarchaeum sp. JOR-1 TaxID=2599399 RepID=UPI00119899D2|nr:hypothetical protein [Salarchaeum sp. JOR-1]QDX40853.1 hypothetical protein FQU85_08040 [Salarchaeum sp. JOR-1]